MSDLICPHCRETVTHGATVCRGCQAEIVYGEWPTYWKGIILIACIVVGGMSWKLTLLIVPDSLAYMVGVVWFVAFFGTYFAAVIKLRSRYRDRVIFKRIYRTN